MELPRAVKEAEERANALIQAQGKREGTPEETPPPAPEPEPGPEASASPPQPEPPPSEAPPAEVQPPAQPEATKPPEEDYEAKYKVLKGKYDKEVPELASQVTFLVKKVGALEAALAEKETPRPPETTNQEPARAPAPEPEKDLTADPKVKYLQTEYPDIYEGTDILVKARAKEIAKALFKEEFERINQRLNAVEQGQVQKTKESFYEALSKAHPNWEQVQSSPEFGAFLQLPDEFSGIPRWQLLKDAYNKLDASRAIRFFSVFLNKNGSPASPPPSTAPSVSPAPSKVEARVAPPRNQNATPVPAPGGTGPAKVTPQELKQFYLDVSQGKWRGREADMKKEEARLIRGIRGG